MRERERERERGGREGERVLKEGEGPIWHETHNMIVCFSIKQLLFIVPNQ